MTADQPSLRAWFVSHSAHTSGAERSLAELVDGLARLLKVHVTVQLPGPGPLTDVLPHNVQVVMRPVSAWAYVVAPPRWRRIRALVGSLPCGRKLRSALKETASQVVVTNTIAPLCGAIAARLAGIPHVWVLHEFVWREDPLAFTLPRRLTLRLVGHLSAAVVVPSLLLKDQVARFVGCQVIVVSPPVTAVGAIRPARGHPRIWVLGNRAHVKRVDEAIRAVPLLRRHGVRASLWLVGTEEFQYGRYLRELAAELGVADAVHFIDHHSDVWSLVAADDVVVSCSASETFGRVVVESMRNGVPVVTSDRGHAKELIRHGETGLVYRSGDPSALADRLAELLVGSDVLRARLVRQARAAGESFAPEDSIRAMWQVLDSVVRADSAPGRP